MSNSEIARVVVVGAGQMGTGMEAAMEERELKAQLLRKADQALPRHALLLSNTSSISLTWLAAQTTRPVQVAGMHYDPQGNRLEPSLPRWSQA